MGDWKKEVHGSSWSFTHATGGVNGNWLDSGYILKEESIGCGDVDVRGE